MGCSTIPISGAKNAALPLMIASLLTDETLTLDNVPRLADVATEAHPLQSRRRPSVDGKRAGQNGMPARRSPSAGEIVDTTAPYELVSRMRASFWVIGRCWPACGRARVSLPGGCAIGTRPVDLLLDALEGARRRDRHRRRLCRRPRAEGPARQPRRFPGHGRRDPRRLMAAVARQGRERDRERRARARDRRPVANCLVKMGARIEGIGTSTIHGSRASTSCSARARGAARPHRDRHLCHGRRHDRRRRPARGRPPPTSGDGARDLATGAETRGAPPASASSATARHRGRSTSRPSRSRASRPISRRSSWR
jgi:UDP-N-acetylglucosamine enolpyruvyl transferase